MSYYFNTLLDANVSSEFISTYTNDKYPLFVPVSSVYQTGRSYTYDGEKRYTETMQPYKIAYGQDFTIDLSQYKTTEGINNSTSGMYVSGSIVLPNGFTYKIKSVSQPANGKITKIDDYTYKFTPNGTLKSGKIYVTLEIEKDDHAFLVDDVELVLEFEQSHEMTKNVLEKTVYSYTTNFYDADTKTFTMSAAEIFENNFAGYVSVETMNNVNPTNPTTGAIVQDCNADVWFLDTLQEDGKNAGDGIVDSSIKSQVIVLNGKMYADESGLYRISLRGRMNVALFISKDGKNYERAVVFATTNASFVSFPTDYENGYKDVQLAANSWLYFKAVMIRYSGEPRNAFMGLGWGKWSEAEGTIALDSNGNVIYNDDGSPKIENYKPASVNVTYATAYRSSYVALKSEFNSDYFYKRTYSYTYNDVTTYDVGQELVTENCKFSSGWGHLLEHLVDGNDGTYAHTASGASPTTSNPVKIEVKLDSEIYANKMFFYGSHNSSTEKGCLPKDFKVWVSKDGENWTLVCDVTDSVLSDDGWQVEVNFNKFYTFSYYKTEITASHGSYLVLKKIYFQKYVIELDPANHISPDNNMFTYRGNWQTKSTYSTFGHVYVGQKGSTLEFEFTGTRIGILSSNVLGANFKVEIDGKEISSIELKEASSIYASYISGELSSGKHKVKITCLGTANIDSVLIW
jgi:hypothetical protein